MVLMFDNTLFPNIESAKSIDLNNIKPGRPAKTYRVMVITLHLQSFNQRQQNCVTNHVFIKMRNIFTNK